MDKMANNNGLLNQIPQAVSQAIQPIVQEASTNITGSINNVLGINGASPSPTSPNPSPTSPNTSNPSSNINARPPIATRTIFPSGPMGNAPYTGTIFDQYRKPGNLGRFISPSEMQARDPSYAYTPPAQLFAEGGMARQADNLASRGRGGDTMLVHMTPDEVSGLQALAMAQGGSLTINPDTGLPEASFLSDTFKAFLPTIAGVGLSFIPGMQPWAAGLLVGGIEAARTKDLGRGLLAGLGAYGGAGLGKGLSATGAEAAQAELAGKAPIEIVDKSIASTPNYFNPSATLSENMTTQAAREGVVGGVKSPFMGTQYGGNTVFGGIEGSQLQQQAAQKALENQLTTTISPSVVPMDRVPSEFTKAGFGLQDLGQEGGLGRFKDAYVAGMGGNKQALLGAAGVAGSIAGGYGAFDQPQMAFPEQEKYDDATYIAADRTYLPQSRESILGGEGREHQYFDVVNPVPGYKTLNAARGGLLALNKMNKGGLLQGSGDGVSDSIPAVIQGSGQPVMLSDGEYIMPAEVVSAIGEGSTASGERKLTNLVDTIMANTRKYAKGKENGSDRLLKGLIPTA